MSHRFYVPQEHIREGAVEFSADQRKQIRNVLRLRLGDVVRVFDGSGAEYGVRLLSEDAGEVYETLFPDTEPSVRLTLVQGLPKGDKIELILQKCTEIGVSEFVIVETERSVPRISPEKMPARLERWKSIVKEAAEQSGRVRLPEVRGVLSFSDALGQVRGNGFIAWEEETGGMLTDALSRSDGQEVTVVVGPEGGFSSQEVAAARSAGITPVSLGRRILRTETAAIVASALVVYRAYLRTQSIL